MDLIKKLKDFKSDIRQQHNLLHGFGQEAPLERTRREVKKVIASNQSYRLSILKNVNTFTHLSPENLITAAQCLEELYFYKGENIIEQDDIGDTFYVIEEGTVSVTRKQNSRDNQEVPKELAVLGKNSYFGEISLLTEEPRSATVTVVSDVAKCLRMTKAKFTELIASTNKYIEQSRAIIGRDVLDMVPLFKTLPASHKSKLLEAMSPVSFLPNTYICRQGTTGNTFYILTDGQCKVTINTEDRREIEVAKLSPGDFFGEIALIELSNKRTANVISLDAVNCWALNRSDFNRLLKNLKVKLMEHQVMKRINGNNAASTSKDAKSLELMNKRRISGFNIHGLRDETRIANILKRFSKYITESLWNSLYSRMYRQMLLDDGKTLSYGDIAVNLMTQVGPLGRADAVDAITTTLVKILEMDPSKRSANDHAFVIGLMNQRNALRDKLCKGWPVYEFTNLCRKLRMIRYKPMRKIFEMDSRGSTAFIIIRGAVRIFVKSAQNGTLKAIYEEDLCPGEMFGEAALGGSHTRNLTAIAITAVDCLTVEDSDFTAAQDRSKATLSIEDRYQFLCRVPLFKGWEPYQLYRLAHSLIQQERCKGSILLERGQDSAPLMFLLQGRVDVLSTSYQKHRTSHENGRSHDSNQKKNHGNNRKKNKNNSGTKHSRQQYPSSNQGGNSGNGNSSMLASSSNGTGAGNSLGSSLNGGNNSMANANNAGIVSSMSTNLGGSSSLSSTANGANSNTSAVGPPTIATSSVPSTSIITTLQTYEYFGESGLLNHRLKKYGNSFVEEFDLVAMTTVDVLILPADCYDFIEGPTFQCLLSAFQAKMEWRRSRNRSLLRYNNDHHRGLNALLSDSNNSNNNSNSGTSSDGSRDKTEPNGLDNSRSRSRSRSSSPQMSSAHPLDEGNSLTLEDNVEICKTGFDSKTGLFTTTAMMSPHPSASLDSPRCFSHDLGQFIMPRPSIYLDPLKPLNHLADLEDIPVVVDNGLDPLMVAPTCVTGRQLDKMHQWFHALKQPKSARIKQFNVYELQDLGFSGCIQQELHNERLRLSSEKKDDDVYGQDSSPLYLRNASSNSKYGQPEVEEEIKGERARIVQEPTFSSESSLPKVVEASHGATISATNDKLDSGMGVWMSTSHETPVFLAPGSMAPQTLNTGGTASFSSSTSSLPHFSPLPSPANPSYSYGSSRPSSSRGGPTCLSARTPRINNNNNTINNTVNNSSSGSNNNNSSNNNSNSRRSRVASFDRPPVSSDIGPATQLPPKITRTVSGKTFLEEFEQLPQATSQSPALPPSKFRRAKSAGGNRPLSPSRPSSSGGVATHSSSRHGGSRPPSSRPRSPPSSPPLDPQHNHSSRPSSSHPDTLHSHAQQSQQASQGPQQAPLDPILYFSIPFDRPFAIPPPILPPKSTHLPAYVPITVDSNKFGNQRGVLVRK